jgi:hypothetical protein
MAAARQRLEEESWATGYGIARGGASIWNGGDDAFLLGEKLTRENLLEGPDGLFEDPLDFVTGEPWRTTHPTLASTVHWNMKVPAMGKVIRELREEAVGNPPPAGRRAS